MKRDELIARLQAMYQVKFAVGRRTKGVNCKPMCIETYEDGCGKSLRVVVPTQDVKEVIALKPNAGRWSCENGEWSNVVFELLF